MTQLVDMLVKNGMAVNEAVEAVCDYTEADYIAEKEEEAREEAYWAEVYAEQEAYTAEWRALNAFFNEHIAGKSYDELDADDWSYYSDWYKDVNGIRPRWYIQSLYEAKMGAEKGV
jgi:hypothetical protein